MLTLAPAGALAHGEGAVMPAEVPSAAPGDGATALGIVRDLEARGAKDADLARVVAEPVKSAKTALIRAHGARAAGDEAHAKVLDGVALEWATAAQELTRAAAAEKAATAAAKKAHEVQTKVERARALLEETQARRGRAAAELAKVEADAKAAAGRAADAEQRRLDAAKKGGKGPAPKAKKKGGK